MQHFKWNLYVSQGLTFYVTFQRPTELGDIMFSLSYLPTAERLTAVVVKCRSLKWADGQDAGGQHSTLFTITKYLKIPFKF